MQDKNSQKIKMYYSVDKDLHNEYCVFTIDPITYDVKTYAKNFDSYDSALSYYANHIKSNINSTDCEATIIPSREQLMTKGYALEKESYYKAWLKENKELSESFKSEFVPDYSVPIKVSSYDQHKVNVINAYERAYHVSEENCITDNDEHMDGLATPKPNVSNTHIFERYGAILEEDTLVLASKINTLFEEYDKYNHKGESADKGRTVSDYNKSIKDGRFDTNISGSMIDIATCGVEELEGRAKTLVNQYALQIRENLNYNAERLSYLPKVKRFTPDTDKYSQNKQYATKQVERNRK